MKDVARSFRPLVLVVLLAACGTTRDAAAAPTATATPTATAAPTATSSATPSASPSPRRVSGSLVRISVNGVDQPAGGVIQGPVSGPVTVRLTFPFDIERAPLEHFLAVGVTPHWADDHTVDLVVPQGTYASFKAVQLPSRDGASVIDFIVVSIQFPPTRVVNVYRLADLTSATAVAPDAPAMPQASGIARVHLPPDRSPSSNGLALSASAQTMLAFDSPLRPYAGAALVDIASDAVRPLANPPASDGPFVLADWLADGRLLFVGKKVWLGAADGSALHVIADAAAADGVPDAAVASPDGRQVALAYRGRVAILELASGALSPVPDVFRACDVAVPLRLAWSRDAKRLAGVTCPAGASAETAQVRILDLATRAVVATIAGGVLALATFPSGELLVVRPSGQQGEGAPSQGLVLGFDGAEHARYLGAAWQLSPDTRYLLQMERVGGAAGDGTFYTLIDQQSAARYRLFLPWNTQWLPDGRLAGF